MHPIATNRQQLQRIAEGTIAALQSRNATAFVSTTATASAVSEEEVSAQRDTVVNALVASVDRMRIESELPTMASGTAADDRPYIPSDQALALIQSAIEEFIPEESLSSAAPFDPSDPGWLSVAWEKLKALFRGKHKFIEHTSRTSFQLPLPEHAVVTLYSDWGTGEETAKRVMRQIAIAHPTHAIHLGDVYYSGTEKEIQRRFHDIIAAEGPPATSCKYLALNSNHEMYSGGHAYFELTLLQRFGQEASYFNLKNAHWQLIGLDSGYEDHGLQDPQDEWLAAQLQTAGTKNILLTHHQLFSPYEKRAFDRKLHDKVGPLLTRVFAWFWGHEHKAIVFDQHQGIRARCIGHGAIPEHVPYGAKTFPVPVRAMDERPSPGTSEGTHGFALLKFNGSALNVSYIDEFGATWFSEQL